MHGLTRYYREREGFLAAYPAASESDEVARGCIPVRAARIAGRPDTVIDSGASASYLKDTCTRVTSRRHVPRQWLEALDGPDSGLEPAVIAGAARLLFAASWASEWEEAGGRFAPGQEIATVSPLRHQEPWDMGSEEYKTYKGAMTKAESVVRTWVGQIDRALPYPLIDLFDALEFHEEAQQIDGLYLILMASTGRGIGLDDDHSEALDRAAQILGARPEFPALDSCPMGDLAREWVESHPPDPKHGMMPDRGHRVSR